VAERVAVAREQSRREFTRDLPRRGQRQLKGSARDSLPWLVTPLIHGRAPPTTKT